jgi:uncharacterized membrane-anchored protein YitT (DUF2179 family)
LKRIRELIFDYIFIALGTGIYSAAVALLLEPAEITPGGLTGVAVVFNDIFSLPTGLTIIVLNLPLIVAGLKVFGGNFIIKTAVSVMLTSFYVEFFESMSHFFNFDIILSSVFGGALLGLGLGIVMSRGATTGGIDIAVKLINKRFKCLAIGRLFLLFDSAVIILAAIVYANIETALYSIIAIFLSSQIIDMLLNERNLGRIFFIITEKGEEIKTAILTLANRGVTITKAYGGYTGNEKSVLICAAYISEVKTIRRIILENDPKAFFFVANVNDINGEGFDRGL